jgi:hypothetical protein
MYNVAVLKHRNWQHELNHATKKTNRIVKIGSPHHVNERSTILARQKSACERTTSEINKQTPSNVRNRNLKNFGKS